jgi:hypothetical protein
MFKFDKRPNIKASAYQILLALAEENGGELSISAEAISYEANSYGNCLDVFYDVATDTYKFVRIGYKELQERQELDRLTKKFKSIDDERKERLR